MLSYYTSANESEVRSVLSHAHYNKSLSFSTLSHLMSSSNANTPTDLRPTSLDPSGPESATSENKTSTNQTSFSQSQNSDNSTSTEMVSRNSSVSLLPFDNNSANTKELKNNVVTDRKVSSSHWIDIHDFRLDELKLTEVETLSSALAMFQYLDLIKVLKIDEKVSFCSLIPNRFVVVKSLACTSLIEKKNSFVRYLQETSCSLILCKKSSFQTKIA